MRTDVFDEFWNNPEGGPREPSAAIRQGASTLHEFYNAFVSAGFSKPEALQLIMGIMAAAGAQGQEESKE